MPHIFSTQQSIILLMLYDRLRILKKTVAVYQEKHLREVRKITQIVDGKNIS